MIPDILHMSIVLFEKITVLRYNEEKERTVTRLRSRKIDLEKTATYSIALNALQIAAALMAVGLALFSDAPFGAGFTAKALLIAMALVVIWGAIVDIRDAFQAKMIDRDSDMVNDAYKNAEELNKQLRAQRHDFLNHMQVVYTLTELEEYDEAKEYLDKVYSDLKKTGRSLKTAHTAVNALIAAKYADCDEKGIAFSTDILSSLEESPMPAWEMCRVFGNLIDNAVDALRDTACPVITFGTGEDLKNITFYVENNGPGIAPELTERIFESGFSTKGTGRGMGLGIVRELLQDYGGTITVESGEVTRFTGVIPKAVRGAKNEA